MKQKASTGSAGALLRRAVIVALLAGAPNAFAQKAFFENFNSLPLGPNVEEGLVGAKVWTKTPPAGWTADDSGTAGVGNPATDGVTEWAGWSFADRVWWSTTAGDQRRTDFTFGTGAVMIADPDEWDDAGHSKTFLNTYISTPEFDISGYAANSLVLAFDSSWRPEALDDGGANWPTAEDGSAINNQTGLVLTTFNGGNPNEIIRWESTRFLADGATENPLFKEDKTKQDRENPDEVSNTNEAYVIPLNNAAGANKLKLTFGMINAANDWWWAVDNIAVGVPPLVSSVSGNGVLVRARVTEALGKSVDDTKPIILEVDGVQVSPATVARDGSLVFLSHNQSPNIYQPGTKHTVAVKFTANDGRQITDGGEFTAPGYTTIASTPAVVVATVRNPSYFTADASKGVQLKLDGTPVTATSVTPNDTGLVVRYALQTPLPPGSSHTLEVTFTTDGNRQVVEAVAFTAANFIAVPAELGTDLGTGADPGMRWRTHQLATGRDNSIVLVEQQLLGQLGASIHDPTAQVAAGYFELPYVNMDQNAGAAGIFRWDAEGELAVPDDGIPGIPGLEFGTDNIAGEAITFVEIPAPGIYTMVVRSDDGFQVTVGNLTNPTFRVLGAYDGGRGDGPTEFYFSVTKAGVYMFRLLYFEGGGDARAEWYTVSAAGAPALVGGPQTGSLKAYRRRTVAEPTITSLPARVAAHPLSVEAIEGNTARLAITASGDTPLTYQWTRNGESVPGATGPELLLSKITQAAAGVYRCRVTNAGGNEESQPATVSVILRTRSRVLLSENFNGLALGPNVEEGIITGSGGAKDAVFTKTAPAGWNVDNSGINGLGDPTTDGVVEWAGWGFADRAWWASTAGDQTRTRFLKGTGAIAVADGDEWDDQPRAAGTMNTFLETPVINVAGIAANSVLLKFDSSWRPESPQKAVIRVSFDGAAATEVLRWTGSSGDATFHPDAQNETVSLRINNPAGASTMKISFGYIDAGNNWWWALDNIQVSADNVGHDPLRDGLATYLPFDGNFNDASGTGINGTAVGTPSFVAGKVGQAVNVRTVQTPAEFSYVSLGRQLLAGTDVNFTIAFWAKLNSNTGDPSFVGNKNWNSGGNTGFVIATAGDNRVQWNLNTVGGSRRDYDSPAGFFANQAWKHVVVSFDRNGPAETWVDGVRLDSRSIAANAGQSIDTDNLSLNIGQDGTGSYTDGGSVFHNADMDEVAIWARILSDAEIATVFGRGSAGQSLLATAPSITASGVPPVGLQGATLTNVLVDTATRTISADIPAGTDVGFLTISPLQTIVSVEVINGRLVVKY